MTQHIKTWQDRLGNSAHIKSGGAVGEAMQAEIDELRAALAQPASVESIDTSRERVEKDAGNVQVAQPASEPAAVSGWKLVPVEPTPAMLAAVVTSMDDFLLGKEAEKQYREDWAAMLAAAPTVDEDGNFKPRN